MSEGDLTNYRRKHLGYIFQMYNLIPNLNVKENIEVGAYLSDNPLDIDELLNKANELLDASKEYKNFSGIADGMDGSVKFIFVSEK